MKTTPNMWVCDMAKTLVCEIIEQMAGIQVSHKADMRQDLVQTKTKMDGVCALIGGDYTLHVHFFAEQNLFQRFARNMIGEEPSIEDVQDYAIEFFNVLCGRFISEIMNQTHIKVRLLPIKYELPAVWDNLDEEEAMHTLIFISDEQEYAAFSWTSKPVEEMMRRNLSK